MPKNQGMQSLSNSDICIILNAGSGRPDAKSNPDNIVATFAALGASCRLKLIENGPQIESEARKAVIEGFKAVVAAGGDGTIYAVASALRGSDTVMDQCRSEPQVY